jgi:type IV fimbrial biogenesis protein FimT
MNNRNQTGFTLYEVLTTMLIVGVVLSLGIPNMQSFRQNSRMTAAANDLHSSFHLARSEATRAKTPITICASADSMAEVPTCGGGLVNGWIIFADTDGDITVDVGEAVLRRFPAVENDIVINTTGPDDYFSFAPTGLGRGNITGTAPLATMILCDPRGNITGGGGKSTARVLIVTPLGRAMVLADEAQVAFHGGC